MCVLLIAVRVQFPILELEFVLWKTEICARLKINSKFEPTNGEKVCLRSASGLANIEMVIFGASGQLGDIYPSGITIQNAH